MLRFCPFAFGAELRVRSQQVTHLWGQFLDLSGENRTWGCGRGAGGEPAPDWDPDLQATAFQLPVGFSLNNAAEMG